MKMKSHGVILVLLATLAFAGKPPSNVPVTAYLSDTDASGAAYYISTLRTMRLTLSSSNEIQPGQPGYTVPPNPPFLGTDSLVSRFAEYCTAIGLDIGTMTAVNQTIQCPAIFRFNWNTSTYYRVYMTGSWSTFYAPETTYIQIQCNALGTNGYCNDWYIDPIPISNGEGTFSPGQATGRLVAITTRGTGTATNEGDFYMTFHVHVTRP